MNAAKGVIPSSMLLLLVAGACIGTAKAQNFRVGLDYGPAFISDQSARDWKVGYSIGTNLFYLPCPCKTVQLGLRIAYDYWSTDNANVLQDLPVPAPNGSAVGSQSYWEFSPTVRLSTDFTGCPVNVFAQAGYGMFVRKGHIDASGAAAGDTLAATYKSTSGGATAGAGVSVGLTSGLALEILPLYHFVFVPNFRSEFFSLSASLMLDI